MKKKSVHKIAYSEIDGDLIKPNYIQTTDEFSR